MRWWHLLTVCLSLFFGFNTVGLGATTLGYDVVTMSHGEIHNGSVSLQRFSLETEYGGVSIPYAQMSVLIIGSGVQADRIVTRVGDHFRGRVLNKEIMVLRTLDTPLPLHMADVREIRFASRQSSAQSPVSPHAVEMQNGDRFAGQIHSGDFMLREGSSNQLIKQADIQIIDVADSIDSDKQRVQVTLADGQVYQGQIPAKDFSFKVANRYGQTLQIPLAKISTLSYRLHYRDGKPDFNLRRHADIPGLFRDRMVDGTLGPELVEIKGGEFLRGDLQGDGDDDEKPPRPIRLGAFAIGVFEVSFAQYDRFCNETGREQPSDEGWGRGRRPVVNVSWLDATAFTRWLSAMTRQTYRLPTDAEWEYAARAGTSTRYWWGEDVGKARANCEGCGSLWDGEKTAPAGKFSANPFGLHDTAGNVFEWVADCYHDSFADAPADGSAIDKPGCGKRVFRGGAWSFPPKEMRSANRWRDFPSRHSDDTGFRILRELRNQSAIQPAGVLQQFQELLR